jgi:S1-C subfamily serine protease
MDARHGIGVSGAGLIDLKGQLVGLTSAQAGIAGGETPSAFAVSLDADMWRIVDKLQAGEEVEYGFIGVQMSRNPNFRNPNGVLIESAVGGSGADQLDKDGEKKIRRGDFLTKIDGLALNDQEDLFAALGSKLAAASVKIELVRSGARRETTVKLAKLYTPGKSIVSHKPPAFGGIRVDYASVVYLRNPPPSLDAGRIPPGVAIREVLPGSPAEAAKLQVDTMITRVNGQNVQTPPEYYEAATKAKDALTLQITKNEGGSEEVALKLR